MNVTFFSCSAETCSITQPPTEICGHNDRIFKLLFFWSKMWSPLQVCPGVSLFVQLNGFHLKPTHSQHFQISLFVIAFQNKHIKEISEWSSYQEINIICQCPLKQFSALTLTMVEKEKQTLKKNEGTCHYV